MVGVTTTPTNYVTFFTDYASNNARKKFTYYAGSSARILAASLTVVRRFVIMPRWAEPRGIL